MAKQAKKQTNPDAETPVPFEQAIAELESIVKDMESERMPLDQLVERYERGNRLLETCQQRIQEAEQRIEMIAAGKSEPALRPFDPQAAKAVKEEPGQASARPKGQNSGKSADSSSSDDEISLF